MRFFVLLTDSDFELLLARARAERRDVREQAAYMLSCLLRSGHEQDGPPVPPVSAESAAPVTVGTVGAGHAR